MKTVLDNRFIELQSIGAAIEVSTGYSYPVNADNTVDYHIGVSVHVTEFDIEAIDSMDAMDLVTYNRILNQLKDM